MYYIMTADRLTRTSNWLEAIEGGIEHLRDVIVNDNLGIADELERQAQFLVDTYQCEWASRRKIPCGGKGSGSSSIRDETESGVEFVVERGQKRPAGLALRSRADSVDEQCSRLISLREMEMATFHGAKWAQRPSRGAR